MADFRANEGKMYRAHSKAIIIFDSIFPERGVDIVCPGRWIYEWMIRAPFSQSAIFYRGKPILSPW